MFALRILNNVRCNIILERCTRYQPCGGVPPHPTFHFEVRNFQTWQILRPVVQCRSLPLPINVYVSSPCAYELLRELGRNGICVDFQCATLTRLCGGRTHIFQCDCVLSNAAEWQSVLKCMFRNLPDLELFLFHEEFTTREQKMALIHMKFKTILRRN